MNAFRGLLKKMFPTKIIVFVDRPYFEEDIYFGA
jgi:hypothetical protein